MHGPDGTNYPNKTKFLEIVPMERIRYLLGGGSDLEADERRGVAFRGTWTFEAIDAEQTKVTIRMVFPSKETRDRVVRDFGAVDGGRQTLERLGDKLAEMRCEPFVVSRDFDAPRDLVWRAWTEQEHFFQWFGRPGARFHVANFDLRPGGTTLFRMAMPDGAEMWVRAVYREVVPQTKLVWVTSPSDPEGGIQPHPVWPRERLTAVTFAEDAGKTTVTVRWLPLDATAAEIAAFNASRAGASAGWNAPFDQLAAHLKGMNTRA
jgi:uncharacterized protein YndB with AHSA1/START domain